MFAPSGLNTVCSTKGSGVIQSHNSDGYSNPWHCQLWATSLTQSIKDKANEIYSSYPNGTGWYIMDEPNCDSPDSPLLLGMGDVADWLKVQFPDMLAYANLLGYYPENAYKIDNYVNAVHPDVLMYDYYPCQDGSEAKVDSHFTRAMNFRAKGLQYNLPYFTYLQSYNADVYRYPSESELRWEAFSFLAMGYKGFSYYSYSGEVGGTGVGLLEGPTTKGPMYDFAAEMNPEIMSLGNVLTSSTSTDVRYIRGVIGRSTPSGLTDWSTGAGGDSHITDITVQGYGYERNGLIGFFEDDNGEELFMLTNLNHDSSQSAADAAATFQITFDGDINDLLCWDRISNEQTVVTLDNHVLEVTLPGGTGNLYKYNNGADFIGYQPPPDVTLELDDNGCPEPGLHSYTISAKGVGITTLSQFTIDGELHQIFHDGEASEWLGDGSATEADTTDSHVIFGDMRLPDLGGESWDWEANPEGPPEQVTEETITGGGDSGMGTLNNYDDVLGIHDAYTRYGLPSTEEETVGLIQIVVAEGDGFSIDLNLITSENYDPSTGGSLVATHNLILSLPSLTAGDANGDGRIDDADIEILAQHWLQSGNWADGDFNGDGIVNDIDATILAANWNPESANVPEHNSLILLISVIPFGALRMWFVYHSKAPVLSVIYSP